MKRILVLTIAACLLLSGCAMRQISATAEPAAAPVTTPESTPESTPEPTAVTTPEPTPESTPEPTPEPTPATYSATIMLAGDLMCLSGQQYAAQTDDGFDFTGSFAQLIPTLSHADLAMGNLETAVSESNPLTMRQKTVGEKPYCNAPAAYIDALKYAGFDAVCTVNNHCCDAGREGIIETIAALDAAGMPHVGTYADAQTPHYIIYDAAGISVGAVGYSCFFNGRDGGIPGEERDVMLGRYDKETAAADIAAARAAGAEYIIAYIHWGSEGEQSPSSGQRRIAQELADAGADLIAGSHPHVLQPFAMIAAADGRQVPCAYSLGNFVSSMSATPSNDTVLLTVMLHKSEMGVERTNCGYVACRNVGSYGDGHHVVMPVRAALNGGVTMDGLDRAAERIAKVMGEEISEITQF